MSYVTYPKTTKRVKTKKEKILGTSGSRKFIREKHISFFLKKRNIFPNLTKKKNIRKLRSNRMSNSEGFIEQSSKH